MAAKWSTSRWCMFRSGTLLLASVVVCVVHYWRRSPRRFQLIWDFPGSSLHLIMWENKSSHPFSPLSLISLPLLSIILFKFPSNLSFKLFILLLAIVLLLFSACEPDKEDTVKILDFHYYPLWWFRLNDAIPFYRPFSSPFSRAFAT